MNLSLLIPSRNNLEFLKLCYSSIRKNQGKHHVEILVLDDKSDKDSTWQWCEETMMADENFKAFKNNRKERLGISGGFKFLSQQATQEVIGHFHADMFMTEGTLDKVESELYKHPIPLKSLNYDDLEKYGYGHCKSIFYSEIENLRNQGYYCQGASGSGQSINPKTNQIEWHGLWYVSYEPVTNKNKVVCLTRIEPPIYNEPGLYPEKIIWKDAPIELEDWNGERFVNFLPEAKKLWNDKTTGGHFVPFFMFRDEYNKLGGNDIDIFPLQAREDSDWAFRLILAGYETIQIPTFVYHFASRGNRRSKDNSGTWQDSPEWQEIDQKSTRNFIRKWGTFHPLHDEFLKPRKPVKYNIGFILQNPNWDLLYHLEPWCSRLIVPTLNQKLIDNYVEKEQPNTPFNLKEKLEYGGCETDIVVEIDGRTFNNEDFKIIHQLSMILEDSGDVGEFMLGNLNITVNRLNTYENELIICKNEPISLEEQ